MNDSNLSELPNIGKTLAEKLVVSGIVSAEQLRFLGAESSFIKLAAIDENACIDQLYALEGAIQEIRWHNLSAERKYELNEFFKSLKK